MTNEEYHAHPALSASGIKALAKSPAHYQASLIYREETTAMRFGTAFHAAVLEPEKFATDYAIADLDRRTKAGKERAAELDEKGIITLSPHDYETAQRMRDAIFLHSTARELLVTPGKSESSHFARVDGIECKCRPDWLTNDGIVVDLKSTVSAHPAEFGRVVINFGYHLQAVHYLRVLWQTATRFVFIAVEKTPPYGVSVHVLDDAAMEYAYAQHDRLLSLYRTCMETESWPCYGEEIYLTSLPAWAYRNEEY